MYIQCIRKVFRPLNFFHILFTLQPYSKMYCIVLFTSSLYTQHPIMLKKSCFLEMFVNLLSTLLKHLWQWSQPPIFLCMTLQALHTCIWGVSPIYSLQILSSFVRLDGERRCTAIFRSFQRCSIGFKSRLWLGHSRTFRLVPKPLMRCLGCVLRRVVLLKGEPWPQSENLLQSAQDLRLGIGSPSNRTTTLSTQPRQSRSGFGTSLWMSLSGPARGQTWTRSNITGETWK